MPPFQGFVVVVAIPSPGCYPGLVYSALSGQLV